MVFFGTKIHISTDFLYFTFGDAFNGCAMRKLSSLPWGKGSEGPCCETWRIPETTDKPLRKEEPLRLINGPLKRFQRWQKYSCCGISAHSISLLREELLSQNFACIVEEPSILGPCCGFWGCSANSGLQKMSRFCGNSSYGEVINNSIQEGKSYLVNLKTFLIRVSTHPKNDALLTFVDITCTQNATCNKLPKGCGTSHPHNKKTRYVFQVQLDVQDRPRGNSQPQRLLNLERRRRLKVNLPGVQTTGDQTGGKFHLFPPLPQRLATVTPPGLFSVHKVLTVGDSKLNPLNFFR